MAIENDEGLKYLDGVMCKLEEWHLLAELTSDDLEAAELYAAVGDFRSAAKRMKRKLATLSPSNREVLCWYYLKVSVDRLCSRECANSHWY